MLGNTKGKMINQYVPDYVLYDLETTGTSSKYDEVIEISAVKVKNDPPDDDAKVPADRAVPVSVCQCNRWLVSDRNTVHNHDTKISYQND